MPLTPLGGPQVGRMLAIGTLTGRWTLEDLDKPSAHWLQIERDRLRSATPGMTGSGWPAMRYPDADTGIPYRNLAREWIAGNPTEWAKLMQEHLEAENSIPVPTGTAPQAREAQDRQPAAPGARF
jgi:hypothetical protein